MTLFRSLPRLRRRPFIVWAILLAGLAVLLCFVPLFNLLGFEFSLALCLPAALASACLTASHTLAVGRISQNQPEKLADFAKRPARLLFLLWCRSLLNSLGLVVLPLLIISLNALRVKNCS